MPGDQDGRRANRAFLARAVRYLRECGVRQFLDIGTGLPVAATWPRSPRTRVVYADNDPIVCCTPGPC